LRIAAKKAAMLQIPSQIRNGRASRRRKRTLRRFRSRSLVRTRRIGRSFATSRVGLEISESIVPPFVG